jgi:2-dehydropantoate 2-reductase
MRVAIVGAGAIGTFLGAALMRGGLEVVLIGRGAQLEAIRTNGLHVESPAGNFDVRPTITDDLDSIEDADVVVLAVKAYSLVDLAEEVGKRLSPHATVLPAQNGVPWWYFQTPGPCQGLELDSVDPGGRIARGIAISHVVGCVVYVSAETGPPGVVRHVEGTRFALGEPNRRASERCSEIARTFRACGIETRVRKDLRGDIWLKLIGNAAFNPLSALTGATLGELGTLEEMRDLLRALLEEGASVAHALEVPMRLDIGRRLDAGIAVGDHKTSMLQDLERGRPLEFQCMTGAICEIARTLNLPVPRMEAIHASVSLLDALQQREQQDGRSS